MSSQKKTGKKPQQALKKGDRSVSRHLVALAAIGIAIFLAYANSLNGTWAMDDIVVKKSVGISDINDLIGFRKIASLTFLLNQSIAPFSPANFRLLNILIHIFNTALVYVLAFKTVILRSKETEERSLKETDGVAGISFSAEDQAFPAALLSGVVFGLHPLNINAVAYIVQRMTSLATLFVLLALLVYISAARSAKTVKAFAFYLLCGGFIVLGIFSKENAVLAVPLILLYDYLFISKFNGKAFRKRVLVFFGIGLVSVGLVSYSLGLHSAFLDVLRSFLNPNVPLTEKGWMAVDVSWTPLQHILTEFRVLSRYLFLFFVPLPRFLVFDWWGFPLSQGISEPITTLLSMIALLSLFTFSVWKIKRFPMLSFGILWYLIAVSLESFFAPGLDLYFEHRNYLPLSGFIIGVIGQVVMSYKGKIRTSTLWPIALILCLVLGSLTFSRNFVWKDSLTLWSDTLKKNPSNLRAMMAMGNTYLASADMDDAEKYYREVVKISSRERRLRLLNDSAYSLGMVYLFKGQLTQAKELIDRFDYTVESYRPKILKGFYKALNNDIEGALKDYSEVIGETKGMDSVVVLTLMGDAYRRKGSWDGAIQQYEKAISLDPGFSSAYYGMGVAFMGKRDVARAYELFSKTLSIDPDNVLALADMADMTLIRKSKPEDALVFAQRAVAKSPPFSQPYLAMGNVLVVLGREKEADDYYRKAIDHGVAAYMVPYSRARAYYLKGDREKTRYYLSELGRYKDLPEKMRDLVRQNGE